MDPADLEYILAAKASTDPIARGRLEQWMRSAEIEALGALYHGLRDPRFVARVESALRSEDVQAFVRAYFERRLRENPEGEWSNTRYSAGWDIVGWLAHPFDQGDDERRALDE